MQCPQISDEKKKHKFCPIDEFFLIRFLKEQKLFVKEAIFFFIRNLRALHLLFEGTYIRIWGHLYSAGIVLQLYSALRFERLKRVQKSRAIPWEFWDKVFSLSMPLVCPHLTTVNLRSQRMMMIAQVIVTKINYVILDLTTSWNMILHWRLVLEKKPK